MLKKSPVNLFWFRRDLRLIDNRALYEALTSGLPVLCLFIFDKDILLQLDNSRDRRISYIYQQLEKIKQELETLGSSLLTVYEDPLNSFINIINDHDVKAVFCNEDYEPQAIGRDENIRKFLSTRNISFHSFKDHVIFSKDEVLKPNGEPYTVFSPYSKRWMQMADANEEAFAIYDSEKLQDNFVKLQPLPLISLSEMGFAETDPVVAHLKIDKHTIENYGSTRNLLAIDGTSHASVHLRFGTISIRALAKLAYRHSQAFLSELIWRDFFQSILYHFPHVATGRSFKPAYDQINWRNDENEFQKWCEGRTGYVIVDAGMRELYATGFMHNRARMITASFLCKHLLIDWRWGEAWFAEHLLDFDLAANNGNWQWASGSGCDAAPYFRIFNPYTQQQKFDPQFVYVKKWVPEFGTGDYPLPIVEHSFARERCLRVYKSALKNEDR